MHARKDGRFGEALNVLKTRRELRLQVVALKLSLEEPEDGGRRLVWCLIVVGGCGLSLPVTWAVMATCPLQRSRRRCDTVATVQFFN